MAAGEGEEGDNIAGASLREETGDGDDEIVGEILLMVSAR